MQATEPTAARPDELALYAGGGIALASALFATGLGAGSATVGAVGALLVTVGTVVSWNTRRWRWPNAVALGLVLGSAATGGLLLLVAREIGTESSGLYAVQAEPGLGLALRMALLPIVFSFLLLRPEVVPFSLVPALAMFGLIAGRGRSDLIGACFSVFLAAGLVALGHAMLLTGLPPNAYAWAGRRRSEWRRRHWAILSVSIAVVLGLGYLLYIPVMNYATQYRWQVMLTMAGGNPGMRAMPLRTVETGRSYPVGRGPTALTDIPVLSVTGPPADLWRGEAFDQYTGRAWLASQPSGFSGPVSTNTLSLGHMFPGPPGARPVEHIVRAEIDLPFVIYAPGQIQRLSGEPPFDLTSIGDLRIDPYGCVTAPQYFLRRGTAYRVQSMPLTMSGAAPRGEASRSPLPAPHELPQQYLLVPLSARRVADLARQVAGDQPTPTRKLSALVRYLQDNYTYTLDAPATPRGRDAADSFLFHYKRGYCDMFATSLALMARAVGIPTRVVTGYAGGQYDPERRAWVLRESDGHAWVEAYLLPWGWVSVDATPAGGPKPIPWLAQQALRLRLLVRRHPALSAAAAALALILVLVGALRLRRSLRGAAEFGGDDARANVVRAYAQACHMLRRRGRPRRASQTPLEFLAALEAEPDGLAPSLPALRSLTDVFVAARYGPGPVPQEAVDAARRLVGEIRQALRHRRPQAAASRA